MSRAWQKLEAEWPIFPLGPARGRNANVAETKPNQSIGVCLASDQRLRVALKHNCLAEEIVNSAPDIYLFVNIQELWWDL